MKTEFLTAWQVAAIENAIGFARDEGALDASSSNLLLTKLRRASRIRLSYEPVVDPHDEPIADKYATAGIKVNCNE